MKIGSRVVVLSIKPCYFFPSSLLKLQYNYHKENYPSSVPLNTWSVILWAEALRPSCSLPRGCDLRKLGGGRGGGGTFRFCLRLQQPSFHLSRRRNQNAVFSRSKSYASDSMYDYFDSDSVAKEKGASLQFTVNSVMYMLTCDQGVVLPFFVNLSGRRKKLPPDRKLCTFIQET